MNIVIDYALECGEYHFVNYLLYLKYEFIKTKIYEKYSFMNDYTLYHFLNFQSHNQLKNWNHCIYCDKFYVKFNKRTDFEPNMMGN